MKITAWGLGKFRSVECVYEMLTGEHVFETLWTDCLQMREFAGSVTPSQVVIEISPPAGWVGDLVGSTG